MCLRAAETKNSSIDAHAVNDNFVVIWNRHLLHLKTKMMRLGQFDLGEEEWEHLIIWSCDVHHFFAETMSKGKENDHAMHNTALDALILNYTQMFEAVGTPLCAIVVWSDNALTQYRCRQNFMKVASVV